MTTDFKKQGKKNRSKGKRFEERVRQEIIKHGYVPLRNMNNVDLQQNRIIPGKYSPFNRFTGFPDFLAYRIQTHNPLMGTYCYYIIGVECKLDGRLSKEEKEKCKWLLDNRMLSLIMIAKKGEKRGEISWEEIKREEK